MRLAWQTALVGLLRLLASEEVPSVNWNAKSLSGHLEAVREHTDKLISSTAENVYSKWYMSSDATFNAVSEWVLRQFLKDHKFPSEHIVCIEEARCY